MGVLYHSTLQLSKMWWADVSHRQRLGVSRSAHGPSFQRPVLWLKIPSGLMLKKVTRSNCCLIQKAGLFSHDKRDFTQGETYTESQIITIMSLDKLGSGHMKADKK